MLKPLVMKVTRAVSRRVRKSNLPILSDLDEVVDSENFDKNTIKKFLKESLAGLKLKAIITDGHRVYPSIIEALGAIHQKCIFHKMQTLMKKVIKTLNKSKRKITDHTEKIEKNKIKITEFKEKNRGKRGRISKNEKITNAKIIGNKIYLLLRLFD